MLCAVCERERVRSVKMTQNTPLVSLPGTRALQSLLINAPSTFFLVYLKLYRMDLYGIDLFEMDLYGVHIGES